jgi:hypothetical protein
MDNLNLYLKTKTPLTIFSIIVLIGFFTMYLFNSYRLMINILETKDITSKQDVRDSGGITLTISTSITLLLIIYYFYSTKISQTTWKNYLGKILVILFLMSVIGVSAYSETKDPFSYSGLNLVLTLSIFLISILLFIYMLKDIPNKSVFIKKHMVNYGILIFFILILMIFSIIIYARLNESGLVDDDMVLKKTIITNFISCVIVGIILSNYLFSKITNYSSTNTCQMYSAI